MFTVSGSYSNSLDPFTETMDALTELYGQPHLLALQRISSLMEEPNIRMGDTKAFRQLALKVRALVGMLQQLGSRGRTELVCGSHVSRLLAKLPHDLRANFRRFIDPTVTTVPTLKDLAGWLEYEVRVQVDDTLNYSEPKRDWQTNKYKRTASHTQSPLLSFTTVIRRTTLLNLCRATQVISLVRSLRNSAHSAITRDII